MTVNKLAPALSSTSPVGCLHAVTLIDRCASRCASRRRSVSPASAPGGSRTPNLLIRSYPALNGARDQAGRTTRLSGSGKVICSVAGRAEALHITPPLRPHTAPLRSGGGGEMEPPRPSRTEQAMDRALIWSPTLRSGQRATAGLRHGQPRRRRSVPCGERSTGVPGNGATPGRRTGCSRRSRSSRRPR